MIETHHFINRFKRDALAMGLRSGGVLMVHSSLRSLGYVPGGPETVIQALLTTLGEESTLLMPALSYEHVRRTKPVFDVRNTPSNVGIIPETFRKRGGTRRSLHPTHSVCSVGPLTDEFIFPHTNDSTPCGPNSPFHRLPDFGGQILMLGCGLRPNTSMHAIEEMVEPPYLYAPSIEYELIREDGMKIYKTYLPHNFRGWEQRYDRIRDIMHLPGLRTGSIVGAEAHLIDAKALWVAALDKLNQDICYFVDQIDIENKTNHSEAHHDE